MEPFEILGGDWHANGQRGASLRFSRLAVGRGRVAGHPVGRHQVFRHRLGDGKRHACAPVQRGLCGRAGGVRRLLVRGLGSTQAEGGGTGGSPACGMLCGNRAGAAGLVRDGLVFFGRWRSSGCHRAGRRLFRHGHAHAGVRMAGGLCCVRAGHRPRARRPFVRAGRRFALCVRHAGFRRRIGRGGARPCRGGGLRPASCSKGGSGTACRDDRRRRRAVHVEAAGRPGVRDVVVAAGRRHDRQLHPGPCMGPGGFADRHDRRLVGPAWSPDRQWAPW